MNIILTLVSQAGHQDKEKINKHFYKVKFQDIIDKNNWIFIAPIDNAKDKTWIKNIFYQKIKFWNKFLYIDVTFYLLVSNVLQQLILNIWEQKLW